MSEHGRLIVDSQVHLWRADTPSRPWAPGATAQLPAPMTIERFMPLMEKAGVDRAVIVPPTLEGVRVDYGQEAARRYPGRFAVMGRIALDDPREAARLPGWRAQPSVLGVRLFFAGAMRNWLLDGTADWFWPAAEEARLPVMFLTNGQTPLFAAIAERHPRLELIIDHMGLLTDSLKNGVVPTRIAECAALAKYPNVSVKLSAAPLSSAQSYPWRDMTPHLHRLYDVFGPKRCYWGTDLTNSFARATYRQRVTHFTEELDFLSEEDKDWVMGRAILERLGWA
jgi:predicted TIM-barrel fold metal-dependent hydrolase